MKKSKRKKSLGYVDFIKKYFPKDYANKDRVCIYCHQKIIKTNLYQNSKEA